MEDSAIGVAGAFSVVQQSSDGARNIRRCEDYRRSFHNDTIEASDVPAQDTVDTYVHILRLFHQAGHATKLWCQDLWAAYRQFPLASPADSYTLLGAPSGHCGDMQ